MSQVLHPIPIDRLLEHVTREMEMSSTVFSVTPGYRGTGRGETLGVGRLELPLGVAAGPHSQMAQNLVSAYVAGARAFELTTVSPQGARESGLSLEASLGEFIKGYFILQLLARDLGLGDPRGVVFAMGVEADRHQLAGEEMTAFFDAMADASATGLWAECLSAAGGALRRFNNLDKSCLGELDPRVSTLAVVEWTGETAALEEAAGYLLEERRLHTYVRLDPARLPQGPEVLRDTVERLRAKGEALGLTLGLCLAGRGADCAPATLELAAQAARLWPGLPMAYSGGVDFFNAADLRAVGFETLNAGDTLLKPGGYLRLRQLARALGNLGPVPGRVDPERAEELARRLTRERAHAGAGKTDRLRIPAPLPLMDCFAAPCAEVGCPFGEDVPGALRLMSDGRYRDALRVILDRNPLPHVTGALCPQPCQRACTRLFYDWPIAVREAEALCARNAWGDLLARLEPAEPQMGRRVAVLGGGPAGMAAAFLLARRGVPVTLFEEAQALCPALRREDERLGELVDRDAELLEVMGADVRLGAGAPDPARLLKTGYSHVVLAREEVPDAAAEQLRISGAESGETPSAEEAGERIFRLPTGADSPGGVADAIAGAHRLVDGLLGPVPPYPHPAGRRGGAMGKKGKLCRPGEPGEECERCLECATVCECCVDVCPNRANVPITVLTRGKPQILHLDALCSHCGNCAAFCPYQGAPDRDKFTLFETLADFEDSQSPGFVVLDFLSRKVRVRLEGEVRDASLRHADHAIPAQLQELMETIFTDYPYLLDEERRLAAPQVSLWEK